MKGKQPIYPVERYITIGEESIVWGRFAYSICEREISGEMMKLEKLMHDFSCTDPDDMNYEILAKKQDILSRTKRVATMCKLMEDMRNEAAHEAAHKAERESARKQQSVS